MARRASLKNTIQQQHVLHDHAGRVRQGVLARARGRCVQVARHPCALTSDRAQLPIIGPTSAVAAAPGYLPHSVAQIRRAASGIPPRTMPARAADDTWRGSRHAAHKPRIRIGQKPVSAPHPTASAVPPPEREKTGIVVPIPYFQGPGGSGPRGVRRAPLPSGGRGTRSGHAPVRLAAAAAGRQGFAAEAHAARGRAHAVGARARPH